MAQGHGRGRAMALSPGRRLGAVLGPNPGFKSRPKLGTEVGPKPGLKLRPRWEQGAWGSGREVAQGRWMKGATR